MSDFIWASIAASIGLTVLLNVLPRIFPTIAASGRRHLEANARRRIEQHEDTNQPRVKVFSPWKAMVVISIILTVLVNLVGFFTAR